ncbi:MAG: response regulator [Calditrichaeota bacterium]|nr:response regulator [Calditrichota bacterium]
MTKKKVLIVDDDHDTRSLLHRFLEHEPYQLMLAKNGYEALEFQKKQKFHLIITDIDMPELDGLSLIGTLRDVYPKIKIIAYTGVGGKLTSESIIELASEAGADDVTIKPFRKEQILDMVRKLI